MERESDSGGTSLVLFYSFQPGSSEGLNNI